MAQAAEDVTAIWSAAAPARWAVNPFQPKDGVLCSNVDDVGLGTDCCLRLRAMVRGPRWSQVWSSARQPSQTPCKIGINKPVSDLRDDLSPWGVASRAEWFSAYPIFNPMLKQAGVRWLRGFYEWQTIQPRQGSWNFTLPDRLLKDAQANGIHLTGMLAYFAPWASADGGTRKFPIKNIQFWRDYVAGMVERYHSDIKYWEVWNEFNGSFAEDGTPTMYAELVREASLAANASIPARRSASAWPISTSASSTLPSRPELATILTISAFIPTRFSNGFRTRASLSFSAWRRRCGPC